MYQLFKRDQEGQKQLVAEYSTREEVDQVLTEHPGYSLTELDQNTFVLEPN